MILVELEPELEAELALEARDKGMNLPGYVRTVLLGRTPRARTPRDLRAIDEAIEGMRRLRELSVEGPETMKELINEGRRY